MTARLLIGFLLIQSAVLAASEPPGWAAFVEGDFALSREQGRAADSAEGLAQACRAGLVQGGFAEKGQVSINSLHRAISDCADALQKDPSHFYAKMSMAIALSFEGKRLSNPAYPKAARAYLLELVSQEPQNPLGYGALGAWHSEVSAAGFFARLALGARRKKARANFEKALEMGAIDYALKLEYVKFLARGSKKERRRALQAAQALLREKPETAFDKLLKSRCEILLTALQDGKKRSIKKALKSISAFQNAPPEKHVRKFPLETLQHSDTK